MSLRRCIITLLLATPLCIAAQQDAVKPVRFNIGIKAGFHALTYSDPEFEIEGYTFDKNCIHSNRIGYTVSPFLKLFKNKSICVRGCSIIKCTSNGLFVAERIYLKSFNDIAKFGT